MAAMPQAPAQVPAPKNRNRRETAAPPTKRIQHMLLIKNGRVIDPASKTDAVQDILLDGENIVELAAHGKLASDHKNAEVFDATGLIVAPGFIDLHAHLREPGQESSETIETGTRAAARGGFTA